MCKWSSSLSLLLWLLSFSACDFVRVQGLTRGPSTGSTGTTSSTSSTSTTTNRGGAPNGADASPEGPFPRKEIRGTTDVWLVDNIKGIEANQLERPEDLQQGFSKWDRRFVVHTVDTVHEGAFCAHAWTVRNDCVPLTGEDGSFTSPSDLNDSNVFGVPRHASAVYWVSLSDDIKVGSQGIQGQQKPLAKNTPGFILWGAGALNTGPDRPVYFLAIDGGVYVVKLSKLALGMPPVSSWPPSVQHSMYDLRAVGVHGLPPTISNGLAKDLKAKRDALVACSVAAWKPSDAEFNANDAANVTERTRQNRAKQLVEKYRSVGWRSCRQPFVAYAEVAAKTFDERKAWREKLYADQKAHLSH